MARSSQGHERQQTCYLVGQPPFCFVCTAGMSGLIAGDPANQWEWHQAHRDMMKNMYRTSYSDMTHGHKASVRSDFPSGYGGHVPSVRHDIAFRNTAFDREQWEKKNHPARDKHPSFDEQIAGAPCHTNNPMGARRRPTDGTTSMPKCPWAVATTRREPLTHRMPPPTVLHPDFQYPQPHSARGMRSHELKNFNTPRGARSNSAARAAGSMLAGDATPRSTLASDAGPGAQAMAAGSNGAMPGGSNGPMPDAMLARGVPSHIPHDYENDNVYTATRRDHGWSRHADPQGENHPEPAVRPVYYQGDSQSSAQPDTAVELGASATLDAERSRRSVSFADDISMNQQAS